MEIHTSLRQHNQTLDKLTIEQEIFLSLFKPVAGKLTATRVISSAGISPSELWEHGRGFQCTLNNPFPLPIKPALSHFGHHFISQMWNSSGATHDLLEVFWKSKNLPGLCSGTKHHSFQNRKENLSHLCQYDINGSSFFLGECYRKGHAVEMWFPLVAWLFI